MPPVMSWGSGRMLLYFPLAHQTGEQTTCRIFTLHVKPAEINCDLSWVLPSSSIPCPGWGDAGFWGKGSEGWGENTRGALGTTIHCLSPFFEDNWAVRALLETLNPLLFSHASPLLYFGAFPSSLKTGKGKKKNPKLKHTSTLQSLL